MGHMLPNTFCESPFESSYLSCSYFAVWAPLQTWQCLGAYHFLCGVFQGGRTWQPFVGDKNGHENFRQVHIYNFRDKFVVFARNRKFANLTQ